MESGASDSDLKIGESQAQLSRGATMVGGKK